MVRPSVGTLAVAIASTFLLSTSRVSAAPTTVTFAFDDARYLHDGEHEGGLVYADEDVTEPMPLVVFLHGVNEAGPLHRGLGGAFDVRPVVDQLTKSGALAPIALAGPSETKDAWSGGRLWASFDLDAFVAATEQALAGDAKIDRSRVVLAAHSGAGCNAKGGLFAPHGKIVPMALLALDTCMDPSFGKLLGEATQRSSVHVFWQSAIWPRDVDGFQDAFAAAMGDGNGTIERLAAFGANPHEELASVALKKVLPDLFPPDEEE